MELKDKRYIVGIDLGTTNSAVSYVDLQVEKGKAPQIRIFNIPQLTGAGEVSGLPVLPSFLYIPGLYDISREAVIKQWDTGDDNFVGAFARDHGAKVPARLVSSSKSWLCHSRVDRRAKILPWGSGEEVAKVSPVQASASFLNHIRNAWNADKGEDDDLYLENQVVIITVPASFDEVARDLTVEAAYQAGLTHITLLEEPLAAFYSWLIRHEHNWSDFVQPGELILVCDVGGGTTDFTLITLREVDGTPRFERIAVGDHLILGGDNVDLALARRIEMRFQQKKFSVSGDKWKSLCHQCRQAKELLLDGRAQSARITLMGEGSRLIAGTLSADLDRKEVQDAVVEGFFPLIDTAGAMNTPAKKGITEFGLPYEPEPAVTLHLGKFLEKHGENVKQVLGKEQYAPDLILFNGGSLKPDVIQDRIREAIRYWFKEDNPGIPRVLENPDPDLSVALGASYYGLVKTGRGVRVGSGSARAYYLGVSVKGDTADQRQAMCLIERGLEEGSDIELKDKKFEVLANQPVHFEIYSSSYRSGDRCGDLVTVDDTLTALPPIQTVITYGKKGAEASIPVHVEASYTEIGTLAIWCRSLTSSHRWKLQFQLRDKTSAAEVAEQEIFDTSLVEAVRCRVRDAFSGNGDKNCLNNLARDIVDIVQRPKDKWPLGLIRSIADELVDRIDARKLSPDHESRWLNLAGFCIRPGFGDGFDDYRIKQIWKMYKGGVCFKNNAQSRSEWWIMWRRIAGGLTSGQQRQFLQDLTPAIMPKKGTKVRIAPQERLEIWMAVANMERLMVKDKIKWGRQLLDEIRPKKCMPQEFWALSRLGARELLYGPADRVISPKEASMWTEKLLKEPWRNLNPVGAAVSQIARKTGDRVRDVDPSVLEQIIEWMNRNGISENQIRLVRDVVHMERQEQIAIFGESLPSGIVLHAGEDS
ncbi:MAG: hsp70 family protein [Desulfobacterales bacterium]|nr:hsp70 family protein [Desulfobacterales bacterium]MDD4072660.1 hsp70 family protein [Desulfobacterales bacterium]MDD4391769.1 hsp70 family protein [Desulfobacterales bacterium]